MCSVSTPKTKPAPPPTAPTAKVDINPADGELSTVTDITAGNAIKRTGYRSLRIERQGTGSVSTGA